MPSQGSYPVATINKGQQLLENAGATFGEILLVTDGGTSPAVMRTARDLKEFGYTLSVLAVGTRNGAPIPQQNGGFVTDQSGNIAVPKLEESALRSLAQAGGGKFSILSTDNRDIDLLLSGEVGTRQASNDALATDRWREEGPWILLLLLPMAALAFRRGWIIVAVVFVMPLSDPAHADVWDDMWLTKDQQGQRLLDEGAAPDAAAVFENPDWRAVANYRAEDYAQSAAEFAESGDARSLYNLGNALAQQGELETAIDAYNQVLEIDPSDADAEYNRDLLQSMMDEQEQQQQEGDQSESSDQEGEGEQSESDGEQQEGESQDGEGEQQEGDQSQRDEETNQEDLEAMQEELERAAQEAQENQEDPMQQLSAAELEALRAEQEQEQALEQWLRRIPNDPGALLRNKFRYQYQKTGKDQDGNNTWPDDEVQPW
jgi:Ca-activated chloride channel family protein